MQANVFSEVEGVHPVTGLATDYLNHYNEIVMLLDLVPSMPECIEDAAQWAPKSYADHFQHSGLCIADGVIAAYQASPPSYRQAFDDTVRALDVFLAPAIGRIATAVAAGNDLDVAIQTQETLDTARSMLGRLNGIIHGHTQREDVVVRGETEDAQALVDSLF